MSQIPPAGPFASALPAARRADPVRSVHVRAVRMRAVCVRAARAACLAAGLALAALAGTACDGGTSPDDSVAGDLVGRLQARERYVPLVEALALTGIDAELAGGTFTVLAPTETALRYVGSDFRPVLFAEAQRETLRRVLRHHILPGRLAPDAFADGAALTAIDGSTLRVRRVGPVVTVNGVTVDVDDAIDASNGVAYPAADVLLDVLPTAERVRLSPLLSTFAGALRATGVDAEAPGPLTVLAPLNDGFAALGSGTTTLLTAPANADVYRRVVRTLVLPGNVDLDALAGQTVTTLAGDRLAVTRDADRVLTVGGLRVLRGETTQDGRVYIVGAPLMATLSVGERMRIRPDLTVYLAALARVPAPLAALSDRSRPVTVFAPSNAAYVGRPAPLTAALTDARQAGLVSRVTAVHVVPGRYTRADLTDGLRLTAFDGTVLTVARTPDPTSPDGVLISLDDVVLGEPAEQANGALFTTNVFLTPGVDLFDTLILRGYASYAGAVRLLGLEVDFRTRVRTAFVLTDEFTPLLLSRPNAVARRIVQRTATTDFFPVLAALPYPVAFAALSGEPRTLNRFGCPAVLRDVNCSPYGFEFVTLRLPPLDGSEDPVFVDVPTPQVYEGGQTQARTAAFHTLRSLDRPPALGLQANATRF